MEVVAKPMASMNTMKSTCRDPSIEEFFAWLPYLVVVKTWNMHWVLQKDHLGLGKVVGAELLAEHT